jgi:colicin import membrane protein
MRSKPEGISYFVGFLGSFFAHLVGVIFVIGVLEHRAAQASKPQEVFTVSLEGGEKLGGISQVPKSKKKQVPSAIPEKKVAKKEPKPEPIVKKKAQVESPTVVENLEKKKKAALKKKKEAEQKKKKEAKRKRKLAAKKRAEKAKKAAEAKEAAKQRERRKIQAKKDREKKLQEAISRARNNTNNYQGESANAGGQGFGAAKLGGKGMGGGTLESLQFIAYRNQLEDHIKGGWHWLAGGDRLKVQVLVMILSDGQIQSARITSASGRDDFDKSVLRAVYKASPVPVAPKALYDRFREVRITFDSHQ